MKSSIAALLLLPLLIRGATNEAVVDDTIYELRPSDDGPKFGTKLDGLKAKIEAIQKRRNTFYAKIEDFEKTGQWVSTEPVANASVVDLTPEEVSVRRARLEAYRSKVLAKKRAKKEPAISALMGQFTLLRDGNGTFQGIMDEVEIQSKMDLLTQRDDILVEHAMMTEKLTHLTTDLAKAEHQVTVMEQRLNEARDRDKYIYEGKVLRAKLAVKRKSGMLATANIRMQELERLMDQLTALIKDVNVHRERLAKRRIEEVRARLNIRKFLLLGRLLEQLKGHELTVGEELIPSMEAEMESLEACKVMLTTTDPMIRAILGRLPKETDRIAREVAEETDQMVHQLEVTGKVDRQKYRLAVRQALNHAQQ